MTADTDGYGVSCRLKYRIKEIITGNGRSRYYVVESSKDGQTWERYTNVISFEDGNKCDSGHFKSNGDALKAVARFRMSEENQTKTMYV